MSGQRVTYNAGLIARASARKGRPTMRQIARLEARIDMLGDDRDEWRGLAHRFANHAPHLRALNHDLAADLERCECENANLRTLSLLDADAAANRLTEMAALTNANEILQNQVTGLDAETETQEDIIHDLEAQIALMVYPTEETQHACQCMACGDSFTSPHSEARRCTPCARLLASSAEKDEDKQSPDPMADLIRLGDMVYLP